MHCCAQAALAAHTMELAHTQRYNVVQRGRVRSPVCHHDSEVCLTYGRSTLRLTLENVSNLPIDFLRLSFDDSTIAPAQASLAEGDMSIYEAYESEYQLINRPVFSWDWEQEDTLIPPQTKVTVAIKCTGKVGWYVFE